MRYLTCLFVLFAFILPLSAGEFNWSDTAAFSWSDVTAPSGCNCTRGGPCSCGPECDCGTIALTSTSDPFTPASRVVESFASIYQRAISSNKVLVVGVNRTPPVGNWISTTHVADEFYRDGQVLVLVPKGSGMVVKARLGQITSQDVQNALAPPVQAVYYADPGAGGCSGGASYGTPVRTGLFGGGLLARFAGGSCGVGGCH